MSIKLVEEEFDSKVWDSVANHPLQTWEWGEARKEIGVEVIRVGEFSGTKLKAVYQLTLHKIPFTNWKTGYLPRSVFPSKDVLDFLYKYCKKNNVISVKLEPYVSLNSIEGLILDSASQRGEQVKNDKRLLKSSNPIFPEWTQVIDLTQPEEQLLKNMKPKTRYNIRLAQKKGVIVKEESNERGFKTFLKLYFETAKRQNYYGHNETYHRAIWSNLKKTISHLIVAYYQDIPLAVYELFHFKDRLYYVYGGSSEEYRNLMAAQLIMWETIRLGKKIGAKYLDMWGSLAPEYSQTHPWAGFTRFKEGYGGKFVQLTGSYDLVVNKLLYKLFNLAYQIRDKYLTFKGKFR